jgi:hypothetical protein
VDVVVDTVEDVRRVGLLEQEALRADDDVAVEQPRGGPETADAAPQSSLKLPLPWL